MLKGCNALVPLLGPVLDLSKVVEALPMAAEDEQLVACVWGCVESRQLLLQSVPSPLFQKTKSG